MLFRFTIVLFAFCLPANAIVAQAIKGHYAAAEHDFQVQGELPLRGEWEFYWNQLLEPADFNPAPQKKFIQVPGTWHRLGNYDLLGFGTYRLVVDLPPNHDGLSLYFPIVNASAKVWINGSLMTETGVVSASRDGFQPRLSSTIVTIPKGVPSVEIIVQVSNYVYFSSGISRTPVIDHTASIFTKISAAKGIENFFAGSLIAMFIYQLILYFLYQRGRPYLWLGLICLGVALRALIVHGGSFLLPDLFPAVSWDIWKKIEFGSVYAMIALFPLYIYHLFQAQASRKPLYLFVPAALALCTLVLVTPQYIYGNLLDVCHLLLLLSFIYAIATILKAWRAGSEDARIILYGVLASFPFILIEIVKNSVYFPVNVGFIYLVELGVLVFLLFQVFLLATHYAKSYKKLESLNTNLERAVEDRTRELVAANSVKERLLSVLSHDVKSPLNSLRGLLHLYNKNALKPDEFNAFTKQVEGDLSNTSLLVENILHWTASQLKGVQVKIEYFDLRAVLEENIQLLKITADRKGIIIQSVLPHIMLHWDRNILNLVVRNLLANAIKFSHPKDTVDVIAASFPSELHITVRDYGMGITDEQIQAIQTQGEIASASGTHNEKGTGLGLALCKEYLEAAGGKLLIDSKPGKGSTFTLVVPTNL